MVTENTLDSFRAAVAAGADWVEADLQLTADDELVACHDADLRRLAGSPVVIENEPAAALEQLGVGEGDERRPIPRLAEVLATVPERLPLNLELKRWRASPVRIADAMGRALAGLARPLLVSSFDWPLLEVLRGRLPGLALAPLGRYRVQSLLGAAERLGAFSVHCHRRLATPALVDAAAAAGRPVLVYTINEAAEARRLFALGVAGVFTDDPERLRRELAP